MAKKPQPSLAEALRDISEGLSVKVKSTGMDGYKPHDKQVLFHKSDDYIRLYIGGNRAGKTHGGVMEDLYWATGRHPFIKTPPPPVRIRVVTVDFIQGLLEIMLPKFKDLTNRADLKGGTWDKAWNKQERKLIFANGSEIQFMSYEQELEKFAGTSQHLIHFDEEPPQHIYNECAARLIDTNGRILMTMTPVEGITWVHDEIYEPTQNASDRENLVRGGDEIGPVYRSNKTETTIIEVGMNENPYLGKAAQERYLKTLTKEERAARSKGSFVSVGGKVFKDFSPETHVIPPLETRGSLKALLELAYVYTSTDHGWNNPTAWLWHAVFSDGRVVTFHEHYASEMTIAEHAKIVKNFEKTFGISVYVRTGDPAMGQHSAITGTSILQEYSSHDLHIYTDSVPKDPAIGIAKMTQYFRPIGRTYTEDGALLSKGVPMWQITENCPNFIKELRNLQWQKYESRKVQFKNNKQEAVQKKDDHAFDSAKYFATFLPELAPDAPPPAKPDVTGYTGLVRYDEALLRAEERKVETAETSAWETIETYM